MSQNVPAELVQWFQNEIDRLNRVIAEQRQEIRALQASAMYARMSDTEKPTDGERR